MSRTKIKELVEKSTRPCFEIKGKYYAFKKGVKKFLYGEDDEPAKSISVEDALKNASILNVLVASKSTLVEEVNEESLIEPESTENLLAAKDAEIKALREQLAGK